MIQATLKAIEEGDETKALKGIRDLLLLEGRREPSPNAWNEVLFLASKRGNRPLVTLLLQTNITPGGRTWALFAALKYTQNEELALDLLAGIGGDCGPGLWGACFSGKMGMIQRILNKGEKSYTGGLQFAAAGGQLEVVKWMIELGADNYGAALISSVYHYGDNFIPTPEHLKVFKYLLPLVMQFQEFNYYLKECKRMAFSHYGQYKEYYRRVIKELQGVWGSKMELGEGLFHRDLYWMFGKCSEYQREDFILELQEILSNIFPREISGIIGPYVF